MVTEDSCMVVDEVTGHTYDMRPLKSGGQNGLLAYDLDKNTFHVGVCQSIYSTKDTKRRCGDQCGACMIHNDGSYVNIGDFSDRLNLQNGEPVLHYDHGTYHTSIRFRCAPIKKLHNSRLILLEKIKNHFYFDYFTTLACPFTVHCEASSPLEDFWNYDLSPLKNYNANVQVAQTYFSVCKPLQGLSGCPQGSAVCEYIDGNYVGYGVAVAPPKVVKTLEVVIDYEGGSICDQESGTRFNSTIRFVCNPSLYPGQPIFESSDFGGCHKKYVWQSMAACPNQTFVEDFVSPDCQIMHPLQKYYTLQTFRSPKDLVLIDKKDKFYVQPCGKSSQCSSPICLERQGKAFNMGKMTSSQFLMDEQEMRITYENGDACESFRTTPMNYSAEIRFVCDPSTREAKLELVDRLPCHPIFRWTSDQICQTFTNPDDQSHFINSNHSSSWTWPFLVILLVGLIGLSVFLRKPENRERVRDKYVWLKVQYCTRRRPEDRNLLVENNVTIPAFGTSFGTLEVEDDDDLIIA